MLVRFCVLIVCALFLAGCVPSMVQHEKLWQTIENRPSLMGYSKLSMIAEFGPPYSITTSVVDGIKSETWVYKTNIGNKFVLINTHPVKARYLKATFMGDVLADLKFENS